MHQSRIPLYRVLSRGSPNGDPSSPVQFQAPRNCPVGARHLGPAAFDIVIIVGTIVALLIYFRQTLLSLVHGIFTGERIALRYRPFGVFPGFFAGAEPDRMATGTRPVISVSMSVVSRPFFPITSPLRIVSTRDVIT